MKICHTQNPDPLLPLPIKNLADLPINQAWRDSDVTISIYREPLGPEEWGSTWSGVSRMDSVSQKALQHESFDCVTAAVSTEPASLTCNWKPCSVALIWQSWAGSNAEVSCFITLLCNSSRVPLVVWAAPSGDRDEWKVTKRRGEGRSWKIKRRDLRRIISSH